MNTSDGWLGGAMGAKKKIEGKLQGIGRGIGQTIKKGYGEYKKIQKTADDAYAASPKGKKMENMVRNGGRP